MLRIIPNRVIIEELRKTQKTNPNAEKVRPQKETEKAVRIEKQLKSLNKLRN